PVKPGAEQRVDDQVGACGEVAPRIFDRSVPGARREAGVALQLVAGAEEIDEHLVARPAEEARGDEAVAAIVPWPAENGDAGTERDPPADGRRDRLRRTLPEQEPSRAPRH